MPARRPSPKAAKARKTGTAKAAAKAAVKAASRNGHARKAPAVKAVKAVKPAGKPGTRSAVKKESPAPKPIEMPLPKTPEVDEGDGLEIRPNLLAGPRNVQPYVVRKGEEYMSKEQLEHFRMILQSWKQDLVRESVSRHQS